MTTERAIAIPIHFILSKNSLITSSGHGNRKTGKLSAITTKFWRTKVDDKLNRLQAKLIAGEDAQQVLRLAVSETAANIVYLLEKEGELSLLTSWASDGLYWHQEASGRLLFSDEENRLAAETGNILLEKAKVIRFLHDDANVSPLGSIFKGIRRIPGGCHARFKPGSEAPELTPFPLISKSSQTRDSHRELAKALRKTAKEIVKQANEGLIYAQVSGGLDGLVIAASLAKQGGRILAIYGDDGGYQHKINQRFFSTLQRNLPYSDLTYQWIRKGSATDDVLRKMQEDRCLHLVKGNYLKKDYKLALADYGAKLSSEPVICAVNGYGIDELYVGAKGDASLSTIYPLNTSLLLARLLSTWRTSHLGLLMIWLRLRIDGMMAAKKRTATQRLMRHLIFAGKAGGILGRCAQKEIQNCFRDALLEDGRELSQYLSPLLPTQPSFNHMAAYCKRFIYGFVEQAHLARFAAHSRSANINYILPFESGRIRRSLEGYIPPLSEAWNAKQGLGRYLKKMNLDYNNMREGLTPQGVGRKKHLHLILKAIKQCLKIPGRQLTATQEAVVTDTSLNQALQQVRHGHPSGEGVGELLCELRKITGNQYVDCMEEAIQCGSAMAGLFTTKQVYNYAHLVRYVLATRGSAMRKA